MVYILVIILGLISSFSILETEEEKGYKPYIYWTLGLILVLTAGLREVGLDHDSMNYENHFIHNDDFLAGILVEYSYLLICRMIRLFSDNVHIVFLIYAFGGVLIKMFAIKKLSPMIFLPLVIYFGNYFLLHEMTQIRAGMASAFFLLAIKPLSDGRKWLAFLLMLCSVFFHYSAAVLFPLLFLSNKELTPKVRIALAGIVPFVYALYFMKFNIIASIPIPFISNKIEIYEMMRDKGLMGDEINVFNLVFAVKVLIFLYALYFYETIHEYNKYISILLKIMGISIASFVILAGLPVMAFRVSELFGIVDIIVFSNIYYTIRPAIISKVIVTIIGISLFAINILFVGLFDPSKAPVVQ